MNEYTLDELMKEVYRRSLYNAEESQKALDEVISENIDLKNENQRLNNIIDELERWLNKIMEEQMICYEKYPEDWKNRTSVSNTWLTSRDCYWSTLNKLDKLKELKEGKE